MARAIRTRTSQADPAKALRYWEVDVARGLAMVAVVLYHLVYDLDVLGGYPIESTSGFWGAFASTSAFAFVFLAGLSLSLGYAGDAGSTGRRSFGEYLRRGLKIFSFGMLITFVFWMLDFGIVVFGILHLIGASVVLAYPFLRLRLANLILGLSLVALGFYLRAEGVGAAGAVGVLLAPFGVDPKGLYMPDYRPLLPWFGVLLLGLSFGNAAYHGRSVGAAGVDAPPYAVPLALLGRHTLLAYLIHQPVLIATLWAIGAIDPGF